MNQDIKKNRTTDITLTVLKPDQTPLSNQEVTKERMQANLWMSYGGDSA